MRRVWYNDLMSDTPSVLANLTLTLTLTVDDIGYHVDLISFVVDDEILWFVQTVRVIGSSEPIYEWEKNLSDSPEVLRVMETLNFGKNESGAWSLDISYNDGSRPDCG